MKNIATILATTAALSLAAVGAYAADAKTETKVEYKKDGGYESKTTATSTTETGTKKEAETKVDVDVDSKGLVTKTVESEKVVDPEGLMNKEKETAKTKIEEKSDGYEKTTSTSSVDHDGTTTKAKTSVDVETDAQGNVVETLKTKKVVDPKGLLNKESATTTTKIVNGTVVEHEKK